MTDGRLKRSSFSGASPIKVCRGCRTPAWRHRGLEGTSMGAAEPFRELQRSSPTRFPKRTPAALRRFAACIECLEEELIGPPFDDPAVSRTLLRDALRVDELRRP